MSNGTLKKARLSAQMVRLIHETDAKVLLALAASPEDKLPLVIDALASAVDALGAMADRMYADV